MRLAIISIIVHIITTHIGQIQAVGRRPNIMEGDSDEDPIDDIDEIIQRQKFELGAGLDISDFLIDADEKVEEKTVNQFKEIKEEIDTAMGEISSPFESSEQKANSKNPGEILSDGTVSTAPELDSVTELAVVGEKRLHWGLMISMIVIYSLIGLLVGLYLPPFLATIGLILLAGFGFYLGNKWIPTSTMNLLGVTWIIISMKLLYGLAIDFHHWGWLEIGSIDENIILGTILLILISMNIFVAYKYDTDAIAAQATLVLLAVASGAGEGASSIGINGEYAVAIMIIIATFLLHSLAWHRKSGNLASLGIAASNLWVGVHALSSGWEIGALKILGFSDPLLLFILFAMINTLNAIMATRFSKEENWFSKGFETLGLGRPGLWSVSVGLGLVGALMSIVAYRLETGYALAQILFLLAAFGGSYLSVRNVSVKELTPTLFAPAPFAIVLLIVMETYSIQIPNLSSYGIFSILSACLITITLLKYQSSVSDVVLWTGSLLICLLLTILIPASSDGDGGLFLLSSLLCLFIGTATLGILRKSPSLAGITIMAPWIWVFLFGIDASDRIIGQSIIDISLNQWYFTSFLFIITLMQYPVNKLLGDTGVNLGAKLLGLSEIGTRLRDSGMLRLWNIGYFLALIGWLSAARIDGLPGEGLVLGLLVLYCIHVFAEIYDQHQSNPTVLLIGIGITGILAQMRFGLDVAWPTIFVIGTILLLRSPNIKSEERMISLLLGFVAASIIIFNLRESGNLLIDERWWPDELYSIWILLIISSLALFTYLPRAHMYEKLLQPAIAAMLMIISLLITAGEISGIAAIAAFALFLGSGGWLAAQGEIRSGIMSVTRKEERLERLRTKQLVGEFLSAGGNTNNIVSSAEGKITYHYSNDKDALDAAEGSGNSAIASTRGSLKVIDPELIQLLEKQQKRRKRSGTIGQDDLLIGDIHHRPVIVLTFIAGIFAYTGYYSFGSSSSEGMLILAGITSIFFVSLSRWRANSLKLRMPDILGIEFPIAATIMGLCFVYLIGRLHAPLIEEQLSLLILVVFLSIFSGFALVGRDDLALRIPSALEWLLYGLVISRLLPFIVSGAVATPFDVNPFSYNFVTWSLPWIISELVLLGAVFSWNWIEGIRIGRELPDHRGVMGRSIWIWMVAIVSWGPAVVGAVIFGIIRARQWKQPEVVCVSLPILMIGIYSISKWIIFVGEIFGWIVLLGGLISLVLLLISVSKRLVSWSSCWLWDSHLLLISGCLITTKVIDSWLVISILILSLSVWVTGILQNRRSLRIWGAFDLIAAWLISLFVLFNTLLEPIMGLAMLVFTGILLGVVTWLGQKYESVLSNN